MHAGRMEHNPDGFGDDVRHRLSFGQKVSGPEYARRLEHRRTWRRSLEHVFESVDLILSPMNLIAAPSADAEMIETTARLTRLTYGWSLGDLPAISIPCPAQPATLLGVQVLCVQESGEKQKRKRKSNRNDAPARRCRPPR